MPRHPLEPSSASEFEDAVLLIKTLNVFSSTTRIISIMLHEPQKSLVYEWQPADPADRQANVVLFDNARNTAYTVQLNLSAGSVVEWQAAPTGSQPTLSMDEQVECAQAVRASKTFHEALQRQVNAGWACAAIVLS